VGGKEKKKKKGKKGGGGGGRGRNRRFEIDNLITQFIIYYLDDDSEDSRSKLLNAEMVKSKDDILQLEQFCTVSNY